jgi:predicted nucleic acid-binding Zn ribbon protein
MTATRGSRPERIGGLLKERFHALGWEQRLREEDVLAGWAAAVGPRIAAHARPSHIDNHRLTVVTESPVWTQQLALLAPELLRCLSRRFGPGIVTALYFVTGRIEPQPQPPSTAAAAAATPVAIPAPLDSDLAAIPDGEVRESVRSLILAALADEARSAGGGTGS